VCEELLKFNINRQRIYDCLYVKTYKVAAFNNYLFSIAKFALNRKIGYIVLPKDSFKKYGVSRNTPLVHILSGIKEIKI
jgi:phosphoesterase RecJ-like protein